MANGNILKIFYKRINCMKNMFQLYFRRSSNLRIGITSVVWGKGLVKGLTVQHEKWIIQYMHAGEFTVSSIHSYGLCWPACDVSPLCLWHIYDSKFNSLWGRGGGVWSGQPNCYEKMWDKPPNMSDKNRQRSNASIVGLPMYSWLKLCLSRHSIV